MFIQVTRWDGAPLLVNLDHVSQVSRIEADGPDYGRAIIFYGDHERGIQLVHSWTFITELIRLGDMKL